MKNDVEIEVVENVSYLKFSQDYSDDPLDDLLNEFGTEDPAVIQRENELYELSMKLQQGKGNFQLTQTDEIDNSGDKNLEQIVLEVQSVVKELKYYNSYLRQNLVIL